MFLLAPIVQVLCVVVLCEINKQTIRLVGSLLIHITIILAMKRRLYVQEFMA